MESFDDILKFLTTPTKKSNVQTYNSSSSSDLPSSFSQSSQKSIDAITFEEILTKMLAPELVGVEKQSNYILKKEQLKNCCEASNRAVDGMTFEEMMDKILAKDFDSNNSYVTVPDEHTPITQDMSEQFGEKYSQTLSEIGTENLHINTSESEIQELEVCDINVTEFEKILSPTLTPCTQTPQSENHTQKCSKEVCTQTSFDLTPIRLEYSTSFSEINSDDTTAVVKKSSLKKVGKKLKNKKQLRDQFVPEQEHTANILDILSHDVTTLPHGVKFFNNIGKIGTPEWLQSALDISDNLVPKEQNKRKQAAVELIEVQNTLDMYIDDSIKREFRFIQKGIMKIYKIGPEDSSSEAPGFVYSDFEQATEVDQELKFAVDEICKDQNLISGNHNLIMIDKHKVRTKIHDIFSKLYDVLANNQTPHVVIRRNVLKGCVYKDGRHQCGPLKEAPLSRIKFKTKCKKTCYKFCRFLYILGKAYSLLENNTKLTLREIFYQCKHLVKNQQAMDVVMGEVGRLLGLGHWHLNVITQKGLVYGNMKLIWASGEVTNCNSAATAVPSDVEDLREVHSAACFILVVEKEAIYHKLLEEDTPNKLVRPFIMITGKGVPGFNTRLFVNTLSNIMSIPVFILVDADIYGIRIMMTYRFGSIKSCHLADQLALPKSRWLGVFPSEITKYGIKQQNLSKRDKITINSLLKYPVMDSYPRIKEEIQILSNTNKKASIEGLIKNNTFLSESYLPMKFVNKDFI